MGKRNGTATAAKPVAGPPSVPKHREDLEEQHLLALGSRYVAPTRQPTILRRLGGKTGTNESGRVKREIRQERIETTNSTGRGYGLGRTQERGYPVRQHS
jgi:hypothetical protein